MRSGIRCMAVLALVALAQGPASADLSTFSLPGGNRTWRDAEEGPLSLARFLEPIDAERFSDGILPIYPVRMVPVPVIAGADSTLSAAEDSILFAFSRHVAQQEVAALQQVVLEEGATIQPGQVLIPKWGNFPRQLRQVQLLRQAGLSEIPAMINVAEAHPLPPVADKYNKGLTITWQTIWEQSMTYDRAQGFMQTIFDNDPGTHFERIDKVGQDVQQTWILYMDLGRYFPVRLARFYPTPGLPRVSAYTLLSGAVDTEKHIAGLNIDDPTVGQIGFPRFERMSQILPTFVVEQSEPINLDDTVAVFFDPPKKMRFARLDFRTSLDYDIAEVELFGDGFLPEALYTTTPLPLPSATLGRIFWDEEKLGNPAKSRAVVQVQTGVNQEPQVMFRLNDFGVPVEWKKGVVQVRDRRPGSKTFGQSVDLNDPNFNLVVREIFSALSDAEREAVRLTRAEYQTLPGNERSTVEPDVVFWSGAQPVENGGFIKAPGGRPFFQLQVEFSSDDPEAATAIRNLRFEYSAPQILSQIYGEIAPAINVKAGQDTTFVLALKALLQGDNKGFNRLQVFTPTRIEQVEAVQVDLGGGQVQNLVQSQTAPGAGQFQQVFTDDKQFVLAFPTLGPAQTSEVLLKVRFKARVIDFRTNFKVNALLDSLSAGRRAYSANGIVALNEAGTDTLALFLPQGLEARDVVNFLQTDQLEDGNSLAVIADLSAQSNELVTKLKLEPNPFTPNGDLVNDQLQVSFDVQRLIAARPVRVEIFDLSGRLRRRIEQRAVSGGYSQAWDGRDAEGKLVAPGLYLVRVSADADAANSAQVRLVSVAY
ncbi:MAG: hypothetical protein HYW07_23940 [Candidatus Latescibacteria bacterium]|nr:hypothetical protein [Candidatus Latescibacterota bacterium]